MEKTFNTRLLNEIITSEKEDFIEEIFSDSDIPDIDRLIISKVINEFRDRILYKIYDIRV